MSRELPRKRRTAGPPANLNTVPAKKQDTLNDRIRKAQKGKKLKPQPGHEVSADGKEVRTPSAGEFFRNLGKVSKPDG